LRKTVLIAVALVAVALLATAAAAADADLSKSTLYVDSQWLKANLGNVVLVDARPKDHYKKGHIPGAVNAEWTYFANMKGQPGNPGWGDLYSKGTLAKKIGALGINAKRPVVVYASGGGWGQDGWVAWILKLSGVQNVKLLEKGYPGWKAVQGKISGGVSRNKSVGFSIPSFQGGYNVTTPWLAAKLNEVKIIDARTPFEYEGGRLFGERRGGHIPGAVNIPYDTVLNDDMTARPIEDIQTIMAVRGISPEDEIIVYDTAGVRSAYLVLVLRMAGFDKARNYDSSFQEWAGNMELEVVQGTEPGGHVAEAQPEVSDEPASGDVTDDNSADDTAPGDETLTEEESQKDKVS